MDQRRSTSRLGRGLAVLAVVAMGAMAVTPAFSAFNPTKGKIKKLARKQAVKQINQRVPGMIDDVIEPFSATLDADEQTVVLATNGPLQLKAKCDTTGSDTVNVYFDSTAPDWWFSNNETGDGPNTANLNDDSLGFELSNTTDTAEYTNNIDNGSAAVRVGNTIHYLATDGEMLGLGTNVFGHKCIAIGRAISHSAPA